MATTVHDVLIYKRGDALSPKHLEGILQKGIQTQTVADPKEVLGVLAQLSSPIILADCGVRSADSYEEVKLIIEQKALHPYPIVVIGRDVEAFENILGKYFVAAATLTHPCTVNDLLKAVDFAMRAAEKQPASQTSVPPPPIKVPEALMPPRREVESDDLTAELTHELYHSLKGVPPVLFDQFQKHSLFDKNLQGAVYARNMNEERMKEKGLLGKNEKVDAAVRSLAEAVGKWGRGHIYRVAFLSTTVAEALPIPVEMKEHLSNAALLFAWSFPTRDKELLRADYQSSRFSVLRKDLCSRIKDSAMKVALDLDLHPVATILSSVGKLIGREEACSDTPLHLASNILMGAELVDRVCFLNGHWNPRAAYALLRKLKAGKTKDLHPAVLACLVKVLSEAISSNPKVMLSKVNRNNPELVEESKRAREMEVEPHEKKVAITALLPGMRLTRPLKAYDGAEILSPDLLLDQDLIWRIWQLAAIRPLNGPAVVLSVEPTQTLAGL